MKNYCQLTFNSCRSFGEDVAQMPVMLSMDSGVGNRYDADARGQLF
jgi:hypothetical protein